MHRRELYEEDRKASQGDDKGAQYLKYARSYILRCKERLNDEQSLQRVHQVGPKIVKVRFQLSATPACCTPVQPSCHSPRMCLLCVWSKRVHLTLFLMMLSTVLVQLRAVSAGAVSPHGALGWLEHRVCYELVLAPLQLIVKYVWSRWKPAPLTEDEERFHAVIKEREVC